MNSKVKGLEIIDSMGLPYPPYALLPPGEFSVSKAQALIKQVGIPMIRNDRWGVVIRLSMESALDKGLPHSELHLTDESIVLREIGSLWNSYGPMVTLIIQHTVDAKCSGTMLKTHSCLVEAVTGDAPLLLEGHSSATERWKVWPDTKLLSTESVVPFLNQEEIVKFRDVVRSIPDNCYLEWSLSKLGNLYFYEYSKLNPQSVERPYPKSSLLLAEGVGASPGVAFGTIRHVSSFSHDLGIGPEDIIVVSSAGPEILRFINVVAGVVSERGGVTSHGAVIAREFGRPFIVQVENAFQVLKDGTPVIVDGSLGKIMRDEEAVNRRIA